MLERFRIETGYGDVYWLFWTTAVLFYVGWDTVSTFYGIKVWNMQESVQFSRYLINNYGYVVFSTVKLGVLVAMFFTVHLIPDKFWTLNWTLPINEEYLKDVYIPLAITLLGVVATVNNFLINWL